MAAASFMRYSITETPLGQMLFGSTAKGLAVLWFHDSASELESLVRQRFSRFSLGRSDGELQSTLEQLLALIESADMPWVLPLDLQGTAFQQRVWAELRAVPAGRTKTYREIATGVGQPRAVRAVANACGANPVAVIVPCHRVIRTDGSLGGYRWGLDRKRVLLRREGVELPKSRVGQSLTSARFTSAR